MFDCAHDLRSLFSILSRLQPFLAVAYILTCSSANTCSGQLKPCITTEDGSEFVGSNGRYLQRRWRLVVTRSGLKIGQDLGMRTPRCRRVGVSSLSAGDMTCAIYRMALYFDKFSK